MSALQPLAPIQPVNFPNDRDYTHDRLIEQSAILELRLRDGTWKLDTCNEKEVIFEEMKGELDLMILHLTDGSWRLCSCNPSKHLPLISGLASEGFGFAETDEEKTFMRETRDRARIWRAKIRSGDFNDKDADLLRAWSRTLRHRIEFQTWSGPLEESPEFVEVVEEINALSGGLRELEEHHVDEILTHLSKKWGIPKPPVRFVDKCNPLTDAWQVGRDLVIKDEDGKTTRVALPQFDELIFCRGGASPYSISHEFCHYLSRYMKGSTDEESATNCGLNEVGNTLHKIEHKLTVTPVKKSLNTLSLKRNSGGKMAKEELMDYVPLVAGVFAGELIDEMGYIEQFTGGIATGFEGILKAGIGIGVAYLGITKMKGAAKDFMIGMGAPLVVAGIKQQFMPTLALRPALGPPVVVAPAQLTPYARPTGLYQGHPTLQVPKIPPRPGILAPPQMTQYQRMQEPALGGKWMLGGPSR